MANPTTNYGWVLPTPTDLVTDLPADFDVALQGVDTRLKALQPGTTLGDLAYSSATANTNTRLGIGSSGQVLSVSGGVPAWTTISAGGMTQIASGSLSGSSLVLSSIPSTYKNLQLTLRGYSTSSNTNFYMTFNSTTSGYIQIGTRGTSTGAVWANFAYSEIGLQGGGTTSIGSGYTDNSAFIDVYDYATTNTKKGRIVEFWNNASDLEWFNNSAFVSGDSSTAISTITLTLSAGTFDAGTYVLWGLS